MSIDKDETLDEVCERAYEQNSASPYTTWDQFWKNIVWGQLLCMIFAQVGLICVAIMYCFGLYSVPIKSWTIAWMFIVGPVSFLGTTAGAHRLWAHRSYKANLPLRILLMICYSSLGLYSIYNWVRDHRVHHKYAETDADPHNAKRGFLFSHLGWLCFKRHPECIYRMREVDLSDVRADPVVMFQKKHVTALNILLCFTLPSVIPLVFWGETVLHSILTQCFIRYLVTVHCIWCVNSVAHLWGDRPYNKFINPTDNLLVCFITNGEGSHNYHHTFPWDYKTSELPYLNFNVTTFVIDMFAKLGWAYDLRQASPGLIKKVVERIGYKSKPPAEHTKYLLNIGNSLIPSSS